METTDRRSVQCSNVSSAFEQSARFMCQRFSLPSTAFISDFRTFSYIEMASFNCSLHMRIVWETRIWWMPYVFTRYLYAFTKSVWLSVRISSMALHWQVISWKMNTPTVLPVSRRSIPHAAQDDREYRVCTTYRSSDSQHEEGVDVDWCRLFRIMLQGLTVGGICIFVSNLTWHSCNVPRYHLTSWSKSGHQKWSSSCVRTESRPLCLTESCASRMRLSRFVTGITSPCCPWVPLS